MHEGELSLSLAEKKRIWQKYKTVMRGITETHSHLQGVSLKERNHTRQGKQSFDYLTPRTMTSALRLTLTEFGALLLNFVTQCHQSTSQC